MSFFRKIFGNKKGDINSDKASNLTPEEFFNTDYIKGIINKYQKTTTLLRPHGSKNEIGQQESKFGGIPSFSGFDEYPCCSSCKTPLNFILQLYKKDFPDFYFPDDSDLFQLFRCPNYDCPDANSEKYDLTMYHYYFNMSSDNKILKKPQHSLNEAEGEIPDCFLKPIVKDDFPNYEDYKDDEFVVIENKFGEDLAELFMSKYSAIQRSKFGGYPSYTQSPNYPVCTCGKTKEFFFQLSSEDPEDGGEQLPAPDKWNAHGLMIGDVGNIYYYVCKSCGPNTIESNWDCY